MENLSDKEIKKIIDSANKRQINFLLAVSCYFNYQPTELLNGIDIFSTTTEYLKYNQNNSKNRYGNMNPKILNHMRAGLIDISRMDWITDNETLNFITSESIVKRIFSNEYSPRVPIPMDQLLERTEKTIALYDLLSFHLRGSEKEFSHFLIGQEEEWRKWEKAINSLKWLNGSDSEEALKFLYDWINKNKPSSIYAPISFRNFTSAAMYLIEQFLRAPEGPSLLLRAKGTWTQRKIRELPNGKKQCNLSLPEDSIEKLNKLAKENKINRNELIEFLINCETKYKKYTQLLSTHKKMFIEGNLPSPDKLH